MESCAARSSSDIRNLCKDVPACRNGLLVIDLSVQKKMIWDSILFRKQHSGFTKAFSALVGDRNPYVVINKEILPLYLGYLLQGNAFRNNVSLMRNSWRSGKPSVLFPSSKRRVPTCASMFWALDEPQDGNVHTVCFPHKEKKKKQRTETWNDLQKYRNLFTKREIKLPYFPFSRAGKCLTLPYCLWRASWGTALLNLP